MRQLVVPTFLSLTMPISRMPEHMADAGIELIELHGDAPDTHIDLTDDSEVGALIGMLERLPVRVHSVHCPFSSPCVDAWDISDPNPDRRAPAVRRLEKTLHSAARLNAAHVVLHPGAHARGDGRIACSAESLALLSDLARSLGVKIAVENLPPGYVGESIGELLEILSSLDPQVVGLCLDTGHALLGMDTPVDYVNALHDRLIAIHWHSNNGDRDAHLLPGLGETSWTDFTDALRRVGYDEPITVEAVPPDWLPLNLAVQIMDEAVRECRAPMLPHPESAAK